MVDYSINDVKAGLENIKEEKDVTPTQKAAIEEFANLFISCSLKDKETRDIVKAVNFHHHTKTCRKYGCPCRFKFPRFPCSKTIMARPIKALKLDPEEEKKN